MSSISSMYVCVALSWDVPVCAKWSEKSPFAPSSRRLWIFLLWVHNLSDFPAFGIQILCNLCLHYESGTIFRSIKIKLSAVIAGDPLSCQICPLVSSFVFLMKSLPIAICLLQSRPKRSLKTRPAEFPSKILLAFYPNACYAHLLLY